MACAEPPAAVPSRTARIPPPLTATADDPFAPVPASLGLDPREVELGRRLFEDPRVSGDGRRACVDCHVLADGGVPPRERRGPVEGRYDVPTVFNVAFQFRLNWQGTFETLEEHAAAVIANPKVMDAGPWPALLDRLRPTYGELDQDDVTRALAAYQRSLVTPDAPFDRFLRGEEPLPPDAAGGYALFKDLGCASCHQGTNLGGNLFQRFGVVEDAFGGRAPSKRDLGRFLLTADPADTHVFRVPSLRNVAVTDPWFHDGSAATLEDAVRRMARVQLGHAASDDEVEALVAFLRTLTGEHDGVPLDGGA